NFTLFSRTEYLEPLMVAEVAPVGTLAERVPLSVPVPTSLDSVIVVPAAAGAGLPNASTKCTVVENGLLTTGCGSAGEVPSSAMPSTTIVFTAAPTTVMGVDAGVSPV